MKGKPYKICHKIPPPKKTKLEVTIANEMTFNIVKFVFLKFALTTFQTTRKLPT